MHPNYCISCQTVHEGGKTECPFSKDYYVQYTESKSWSTDLKQSDLKPGKGYPEDPGHNVQGRIAAKGEKFSIMAAEIDKFDNGEPNCKVHQASLIFNSMKGGGSGGNHGSSPIDRETATIRNNDLRRLDSMYSYIKWPNKTTGIPTIDAQRKRERELAQ